MFKKTVSIVIVSVLAISIGAVSVFADIDAGTKPIQAYTGVGVNTDFSNNVNRYVYVYNLKCELQTIDVDKNQESTNPKYYSNFAVSQQYIIIFRLSNLSSQPKSVNTQSVYVDITTNRNTFDNATLSNVGYSINYNSNCYSDVGQSGRVYLYPFDNSKYGTSIFLPPMSSLTMSVAFTKTYNVTIEGYADVPVLELYNQQITAVTSPTYDTSVLTDSIATSNIDYNIYRIYQNTEDMEAKLRDIFTESTLIYNQTVGLNNKVQSILDAYTSNVQGAEDLSSDITTNDQKLDNIHQNEAQWYSQNSQAIESTGLSNFEFSTDQSSALTGVFSLFQRLWTALGDYTFVVTFTLMMSFATFFLRHNPIKKTSGNNYSRNYSKGGGESHGSSAG